MNVSKPAFIASVFVLFLGFCIPAYAQEEFKSSDFLEWTESSRNSYVRTAVGMAALIAVSNNSEQADCIGDWFFSDRAKSESIIYKAMEHFGDYHPLGIIVAILEKQCGSFSYGQNSD